MGKKFRPSAIWDEIILMRRWLGMVVVVIKSFPGSR